MTAGEINVPNCDLPNAESSKVPEDVTEVCGETSASAAVRIVGGTQATPKAWPWAAALGRTVDDRFRELQLNDRII